jgi:diguanylate cyclase (GGDEF)-like protein
LILPDTAADEAYREAERIRLAIASARFRLPKADGELAVTVSVGVATATFAETEAWELFDHARKAVHQAKDAGRNGAVAWQPEIHVAKQ